MKTDQKNRWGDIQTEIITRKEGRDEKKEKNIFDLKRRHNTRKKVISKIRVHYVP